MSRSIPGSPGDTIVALATPSGRSGLGIVRLSGPRALEIAAAVFRPKNASRPVHAMPSYSARLGVIVDGDRVLDEALLLVMRAPRSYTCEDVAEFSCHGSPVVLRRIEDLCVARGARRATPGEFTRRAYLHGRIDLAQAEAVAALIAAESALQAELAVHALSGSARTLLRGVCDTLAGAAASLALLVDHPDEPDTAAVDLAHTDATLRTCLHDVERLIAAADRSRPFLDGATVALCGKPNAGKSSLFNILVNRDRAIVSPIPGTTRDTITERITLGELPLTLTDTAGVRTSSGDPLEELGIGRALRAARDSDLIVLLLDAAAGCTADDDAVVRQLLASPRHPPQRLIIALNKIDIADDLPAIRRAADALAATLGASYAVSPDRPELSCTTLHGIPALERAIVVACGGGEKTLGAQERQAAAVALSRRQADLLRAAAGHLSAAVDAGAHRPELAAEHLSAARQTLAEITGEDIPTDVVDEVFSRFCVGK